MGGAVEGAGKVIVLTTVNPNAANSGGKFNQENEGGCFSRRSATTVQSYDYEREIQRRQSKPLECDNFVKKRL